MKAPHRILRAKMRCIAYRLCYHNPMDRVERRLFEWDDTESLKASPPYAFGRHESCSCRTE
jgi:hypothetical protein